MKIIWEKELKTIESERLVLRMLTEKDSDDIFDIFKDEEVAKYDVFHPIKDRGRAEKMIENYKIEFDNREEITWGIQRKDTEQVIGVCSLGEFVDSAMRSEIGYDIRRDQWNKGYGTEAISALVEHGFRDMNLNRIEAFITPGNTGSVRVLEKAGFTHEGIVRERDFIKSKLEDGIVMAKLRND